MPGRLFRFVSRAARSRGAGASYDLLALGFSEQSSIRASYSSLFDAARHRSEAQSAGAPYASSRTHDGMCHLHRTGTFVRFNESASTSSVLATTDPWLQKHLFLMPWWAGGIIGCSVCVLSTLKQSSRRFKFRCCRTSFFPLCLRA